MCRLRPQCRRPGRSLPEHSSGHWKALPAFRGESTERTWVYSIAHNVALTWQAKERRSTRAQLPLSEALDLPHRPTTDRRLLLYELIARLGPVDREVVVLWLEGLTAAEIGEVAGLTPGAVAVRLSRIRQSFAEALQISEARNG